MSDDSLIADVQTSRTAWTGSGIGEEIEGLVQAIDSKSWVDGALAGVGVGLEALSLAIDPLGTLAAAGVGWLIEHISFLREPLEELTGDADIVMSHAVTWINIANEMIAIGEALKASVEADVAEWTGDAADGYRKMMDWNVDFAGGLGATAGAIASATEGAGTLVAVTREIVRDLIAECVATLLVRIPVWLAEAGLTLGLATPLIVSQAVTLVAKWVGNIFSYLMALIASLEGLTKLLRG